MAGATKNLMPFTMILDVPTWPDELSKVDHNKFAKAAAKETLEFHLKKNIPRHFLRSARKRYGYRPRDIEYIRSKQYRFKTGGLDLVKTGKSRVEVPKSGKISASGSASKGTTKASLRMRFPFPGGSGRLRKGNSRQAVQIKQMIKEMRAITLDEAVELRDKFRDAYFSKVNERARTRKRRRYRVKT